jgi:hypothetical protein
MANTRRAAIAIIAALAALVFVFYRYGFNHPDPAATRASVLTTGKQACFKDARADSRNTLVADAKLSAFCGCVMDRSVGALNDSELQTTIGGASLGERMPMKLQAANRACKGELLD